MIRKPLSTTNFLVNILQKIPFQMSTGVDKCQEKYSRAAVACILRISPPSVTSDLKLPDEALTYVGNGGDIEILFMKRTHRGGDRWSGDTAFPGGYLEKGESDIEGVEREVSEELNIDLRNPQKFAWLGRLRHVNFGHKTKLLFPHVYLYLGQEELVIQPEPSEVAGVEWVSIKNLLNRNSYNLDVRSASLDGTFLKVAGWSQTSRRVSVFLAKLIGCSTVYFPCINLPISDRAIWTGDDAAKLARGNSDGSLTTHWVLWGMTLRFVCDLLQAGNDANEPYIVPKLPFWVENKLFNYYLKFWHSRIVYSGSHTVSGTLLLSLSLAGVVVTYGIAGTGLIYASYGAYSSIESIL